jgi:hypothetical protein
MLSMVWEVAVVILVVMVAVMEAEEAEGRRGSRGGKTMAGGGVSGFLAVNLAGFGL